jgi:hypothetical protein
MGDSIYTIICEKEGHNKGTLDVCFTITEQKFIDISVEDGVPDINLPFYNVSQKNYLAK